MDYEGLYKDLLMLRQRAHANGGWYSFREDHWRQLAAFIDEVDQFTNDLFLRGYGYA